MPIRPENRARYPKDWRAISKRIRHKRARNRCECTGQCGLRHHVTRKGQIDLPPSLWIQAAPGGRCSARNGKPHPVTGSIVVLTVMHLNHAPEDVSDGNLLAGCQKCHNLYDAPTRAAGIRARRIQAKMTGRP